MAKTTTKLGIGGRASNVTAANYRELGKAFIEANEGHGFIIALKNGERDGVAYSQTLPQWGAWLALFRRKGIPHVHMLRSEYYTVPAEWPHLFTSDSTFDLDLSNGANFERQWLNALNDPPMRGTPPKPDKPRTIADTQKPRLEPRVPFRPFPRLWEVFGESIDGISFDLAEKASETLATRGIEAAAAILFGEVARDAGPIAPEIEAPVL